MTPFTCIHRLSLILRLTTLFAASICFGQDLPTVPADQATTNSLSLSSPAEPSLTAPKKVILNPKGGFLWKPVSSSDGKLVVLLPASFTGHTVTNSSTIFSDSACKIMHPLGDGRYAGVHNDHREHFRFTVPGERFKSAVWFSVILKDGRRVVYEIAQPSLRSER